MSTVGLLKNISSSIHKASSAEKSFIQFSHDLGCFINLHSTTPVYCYKPGSGYNCFWRGHRSMDCCSWSYIFKELFNSILTSARLVSVLAMCMVHRFKYLHKLAVIAILSFCLCHSFTSCVCCCCIEPALHWLLWNILPAQVFFSLNSCIPQCLLVFFSAPTPLHRCSGCSLAFLLKSVHLIYHAH